MSNIAIIISGQIRNYWYTLPYLVDNIIVPNNADVFCLLENGNCHGVTGVYCEFDPTILRDHIQKILGTNLKEFKFCFEIPEMDIESNKLYENSNKENTQFYTKGIFNQYIKKKYAFELLETFSQINSKKYDTVLFLRPDIYYEHFIIPTCNTNQIYITSRCGNTTCNWQLEAFCFGGFEAMKKVSLFVNEYGSLPYTMCEYCKLGEEYRFIVEVQFGEYIRKYNLEIKPMWFDIPSRRNERVPGPHPTSQNILDVNYPLKYVIDQITLDPAQIKLKY